jgi:uncharacterized alkaline shock family protein YloU
VGTGYPPRGGGAALKDSAMADSFSIKNDRGTILVTKKVIARIVSDAVEQFDGKVFITNEKGKLFGAFSRLGGLDEAMNMEISFTDKGVDIRLFIVVRFGTSIGMVTTQLMDDIQRQVERVTGMEPNSLTVVLAGTISRTIAMKYLEAKKKYGFHG